MSPLLGTHVAQRSGRVIPPLQKRSAGAITLARQVMAICPFMSRASTTLRCRDLDMANVPHHDQEPKDFLRLSLGLLGSSRCATSAFVPSGPGQRRERSQGDLRSRRADCRFRAGTGIRRAARVRPEVKARSIRKPSEPVLCLWCLKHLRSEPCLQSFCGAKHHGFRR